MGRADSSNEPIQVHVHDGTRPASQLLRAVEPEPLRAPLEDVLAALCHQLAELLASDVVSIYSREVGRDGEDSLVMLGNVGLARDVVGNLRLPVGEGIAGWVAECLRSLSINATEGDPRFKAVRGIGEERFPNFLAQPLVRERRCLGVLVLQRSARRPFAEAEVRLAGLLAEAAALVLDAGGRRNPPEPVGTEAVSLIGRPLSGGLGIGRVELVPTAEALSGDTDAPPGAAPVEEALARVDRDLARLRAELPAPLGRELENALGRLELLLSDSRLRQRLTETPADNLASLARDYARASRRTALPSGSPDRVLLERAEEVGELCALLHVLLAGGRLLQSGRVWIGRRLGGFFALAAARSAAAVVLDGDGRATDDALAIARAAGIPLLAGVRGLFAWTRPGDLLVVDADRSVVRINPSASGVVAARAAGRRRGRSR